MRSFFPEIYPIYEPSFGSVMKTRNWSASSYRYGFNGQEKVDEFSNSGNTYSAEYWEYESRIGRRFNTDPVIKYWESRFVCFLNNPILYSDRNGDDIDDSKLTDEQRTQINGLVDTKSKNFNAEFAKVYKNLVDDHTTVYTLNNTGKEFETSFGNDDEKLEEYGSVSYGGKNDKKQDILNINYTDKIPGFYDEKNVLFEEIYHADQFRRGEWGFIYDDDKKVWGTFAYDVSEEVEAKVWTAKNVRTPPLGENKRILKADKKKELESEILSSTSYRGIYYKKENVVDNMVRADFSGKTRESFLQQFDENGVLISPSQKRVARKPQ